MSINDPKIPPPQTSPPPPLPLHTPQVGFTSRLPDFCNLGVIWRLLVIVNLLVLAAALVRADIAPDMSGLMRQFLLISIVAQPAIILSLVATCVAKPIFVKLTYWQGVSAIFAMEATIGAVFWFLHVAIIPIIAVGDGGAHVPPVQFGLFFFLVTAVVLFYFDLRARSLAPALTEARLQALQARIRPHFLFNSINAVLSLIRDEPKRAERMLEDMAELFRVLMADNRQLKPLEDEIALCRQYLEIEHIRLGERLKVDWQITDMPARALVPPLILQPLIENAVYHGVEPQQGDGALTIAIHTSGKQMHIVLTNPYHSESTHVSGNRMAIANIKERLQLHFDAEASLRAEIKGARYIVNINMPITLVPESATII